VAEALVVHWQPLESHHERRHCDRVPSPAAGWQVVNSSISHTNWQIARWSTSTRRCSCKGIYYLSTLMCNDLRNLMSWGLNLDSNLPVAWLTALFLPLPEPDRGV
jgi:hypothetical protein